MSEWNTRVTYDEPREERQTTHSQRLFSGGDDRHQLYVAHRPHRFVGSHYVMIRVPHPVYHGHVQTTVFSYPSGADPKRAYVSTPDIPAGFFPLATVPSEKLLAPIEAHHTNGAWMPLLDRLAEEYPEVFERAVAAHTLARAGAHA